MAAIVESIVGIISGALAIINGTFDIVHGCIALSFFTFSLLSEAVTAAFRYTVWLGEICTITFKEAAEYCSLAVNQVGAVLSGSLFVFSPFVFVVEGLTEVFQKVTVTLNSLIAGCFSSASSMVKSAVSELFRCILSFAISLRVTLYTFGLRSVEFFIFCFNSLISCLITAVAGVKFGILWFGSLIVNGVYSCSSAVVIACIELVTKCYNFVMYCYYSALQTSLDVYDVLIDTFTARLLIFGTGLVTFLIVLYTSIKIMHQHGLTFPGFGSGSYLRRRHRRFHHNPDGSESDGDIDADEFVIEGTETDNELSSEDDEEHIEFEVADPNDSSDDDDNNALLNVQLPPRRTRHGGRSVTPSNAAAAYDAAAADGGGGLIASERTSCVVCQDQAKTVLVLPCRHMCLCVDCAHEVVSMRNGRRRTCPLCRSPIDTIMQVYL